MPAKKPSVISSFIPDEPEPEVETTPRTGTRKPVKPADDGKKKLTIEIPAKTHRAWKQFAAGEGVTLQSLLETTLNDYIRRRSK